MHIPERTFKGWTKPGPIPSGAFGNGPKIEAGETLDAISGHFRLFQLEKGHRFSTDDVLVAWYGTAWAPCARSILDLGAGIGTAGMIASWRFAGARVTMIEAQAESVRLARKSVAWNDLEDRVEIREGDFRDAKILLPTERFDLILGSPPYFPPGTGVEGDHPQKIACRFEMRGDIGDYCQVAGNHLGSGAFLACIFPIAPPEQDTRIKQSARAAGLTIVRHRPIVLREDERPLLGLFGMLRSEDLPESMRGQTWIEPPLIIRTRDGKVHPEYSAVKLAFGFPP